MNKKFQQSNTRLASTLTQKLSTLPTVRAVVLYGSVAKGYSDAYSDIDVVVISNSGTHVLSQECKKIVAFFPELHLVFKKQELSVLQFDRYPSLVGAVQAFQSYRASGVTNHEGRDIDVTIRLISWDVVRQLEQGAQHDVYQYQTLLQYIVDTQTLYDREGDFTFWKNNVASFKTFAPDLYHAFLDHCLNRIEYYLRGEIPDGIVRKDALLVNYELSKCVLLFLNVLYAINNRCLSYPKWGQYDIKRLRVKPARVQAILGGVVQTNNPKPLYALFRELQVIAKNVQ